MKEKDKQSNDLLYEQVKDLLASLGQDLSKEEAVIIKYFVNIEGHITIANIYENLIKENKNTTIPHIKRIMKLLCKVAFAHKIIINDTIAYEHMHPKDHHDHMICLACGKVINFLEPIIEKKQIEVAEEYGFTPLMHRLEMKGICKSCSDKIPPSRPLSSCLSGEIIQIIDTLGGTDMQNRMLSLGLTKNTEVEVIKNDGLVVLNVRGARIALGHGESQKIIVNTIKRQV